MPEKGCSVITVREHTAKTIRKMANTRGLTMDELISELINPGPKEGWSVCKVCSTRVKTVNLYEHMNKVHPKLLTVKTS